MGAVDEAVTGLATGLAGGLGTGLALGNAMQRSRLLQQEQEEAAQRQQYQQLIATEMQGLGAKGGLKALTGEQGAKIASLMISAGEMGEARQMMLLTELMAQQRVKNTGQLVMSQMAAGRYEDAVEGMNVLAEELGDEGERITGFDPGKNIFMLADGTPLEVPKASQLVQSLVMSPSEALEQQMRERVEARTAHYQQLNQSMAQQRLAIAERHVAATELRARRSGQPKPASTASRIKGLRDVFNDQARIHDAAHDTDMGNLAADEDDPWHPANRQNLYNLAMSVQLANDVTPDEALRIAQQIGEENPDTKPGSNGTEVATLSDGRRISLKAGPLVGNTPNDDGDDDNSVVGAEDEE